MFKRKDDSESQTPSPSPAERPPRLAVFGTRTAFVEGRGRRPETIEYEAAVDLDHRSRIYLRRAGTEEPWRRAYDDSGAPDTVVDRFEVSKRRDHQPIHFDPAPAERVELLPTPTEAEVLAARAVCRSTTPLRKAY